MALPIVHTNDLSAVTIVTTDPKVALTMFRYSKKTKFRGLGLGGSACNPPGLGGSERVTTRPNPGQKNGSGWTGWATFWPILNKNKQLFARLNKKVSRVVVVVSIFLILSKINADLTPHLYTLLGTNLHLCTHPTKYID